MTAAPATAMIQRTIWPGAMTTGQDRERKSGIDRFPCSAFDSTLTQNLGQQAHRYLAAMWNSQLHAPDRGNRQVLREAQRDPFFENIFQLVPAVFKTVGIRPDAGNAQYFAEIRSLL